MGRVSTAASRCSDLSGVEITLKELKCELHTKIHEITADIIPIVLVNLITDFCLPLLPTWKGMAYRDLQFLYRRPTRLENPNHVEIDRQTMEEKDVLPLLENDQISEIEMTHEGNQGGSYYRVHVRPKKRATFELRGELLDYLRVYEIVPYGGPDEAWRLPFGGPTIYDTKRNVLWRLSNGALFYVVDEFDVYQFRFIRVKL
jgi:hypothetical protein